MHYNTDNDLPYWFLLGIVSYGAAECGRENVPGVYTRTSSFLEWINENIY